MGESDMTKILTLVACLALLIGACASAPEPEPVPEPGPATENATPAETAQAEPVRPEPQQRARLVRAQLWLNFNARINWVQEHWEQKAAEMIALLEPIDGIERAERGMPAQIVLVVREGAPISAEQLLEVIQPVWEGASPPLVDVRLQYEQRRR
jgi:hypothetical protein